MPASSQHAHYTAHDSFAEIASTEAATLCSQEGLGGTWLLSLSQQSLGCFKYTAGRDVTNAGVSRQLLG